MWRVLLSSSADTALFPPAGGYLSLGSRCASTSVLPRHGTTLSVHILFNLDGPPQRFPSWAAMELLRTLPRAAGDVLL